MTIHADQDYAACERNTSHQRDMLRHADPAWIASRARAVPYALAVPISDDVQDDLREAMQAEKGLAEAGMPEAKRPTPKRPVSAAGLKARQLILEGYINRREIACMSGAKMGTVHSLMQAYNRFGPDGIAVGAGMQGKPEAAA